MDYATTRVDLFPAGTDVSVYPVSNWPTGTVDESAAPVGTATDTDAMGDSGVTLQGLTSREPYVLYGEVDGQHRYLAFIPGEDVAQGLSVANTAEDETITGDWTFSGALDFDVATGTSLTLDGAAGLVVSGDGGKDTINLTGATNPGITLGTANLYEDGANTLKTDDGLTVAGAVVGLNVVLAANGVASQVALGGYGPSGESGIQFGNATQPTIYKSVASGVTVGVAADKVGFYGTAAVAKQTGVAVSAGGVHAALVNLGLIAA